MSKLASKRPKRYKFDHVLNIGLHYLYSLHRSGPNLRDPDISPWTFSPGHSSGHFPWIFPQTYPQWSTTVGHPPPLLYYTLMVHTIDVEKQRTNKMKQKITPVGLTDIISTHADPTSIRHISLRISSVTFTSAHLYGNVYMRVGVARALADSSDLGLLGSKVPRNVRFLVLDADESPCKMWRH